MTAVLTEPSVASGRSTGRERLAGLAQRRGSVVVLALLVLVASLSFDRFLTVGNLQNIAIQSSFLAIVALGMTFVIISGGIDLSVGSVFALGGVLAAYGIQWGSLVGLLLCLVPCGAIGLLNGMLVAYGRLAPFIVTLATLLGARGLLLAITDEGATTRLMPRDALLTSLGQDTFLGLGIPVWITLVLFTAGIVVLQRTGFGHSVFAVGGSREAATLMGLPVARTTMVVYLVSGLTAGLAGALAAAYSASGVTIVGEGLELEAIAAVVIGGTLLSGGRGTLIGTLIGVLIFTVVNSIFTQNNLDTSTQNIAKGVIIVGAVLLQTLTTRRAKT